MRNLEQIYAAILSNYRKSDNSKWIAAFWCYQAKKRMGETFAAQATKMGVSSSKIEWMAHAYETYNNLCRMPGVALAVRSARKLDYIYASHFRALASAKKSYGLTDMELLGLLVDIISAEGDISSRDVDYHARRRFGELKALEYYMRRASQAIAGVITHPNCTPEMRSVFAPVFEYLGEKG